MIELLNKEIELDGLFEDFVLSHDYPFSLVITLETGLSLPSLTFEIEAKDHNLVSQVYRGKEFTLEFGDNSWEFVVVQKSYRLGTLTLVAFLNKTEFYKVRKQNSIEGNSKEALESIESLDKDLSPTLPEDEQIWLQPNMSDKDFCRDVIAHSYVEDEEVILSYINLDGELVTRCFKDMDEDQDTLELGFKRNILRLEDINVEEMPVSIYSYIEDSLGISTQDASKDNYSNASDSPTASYTTMQMGNTHEKYYEAFENNVKTMARAQENLYDWPLPSDADLLMPLKVIDILEPPEPNGGSNDYLDLMGSKYFVIRNVISITSDDITQHPFFCRLPDVS